MRRLIGSSVLGLALAAASVGAVAAQGMSMQDAITVPLAPTNDSGVSGQAMVHPMGGSTMVMIQITGLEPNSRHAAHVHNGACTGSVMIPLEVVVADASGVGTSSSTVSAAPDATWWIQVHRAESPPGPSVTCGQFSAS